MTTLFINATVLPMTRNMAEDSSLTFRGCVGVVDNRIEFVAEGDNGVAVFRAAHPDVVEYDLDGRVLMPGLINTHTHVAMTLQRGMIDDVELMEWLNKYVWPFEGCQKADHIAVGTELGIVEMLQGGTTTFVDMYWHEERVAEVVKRMGARAMLGCTVIDFNVDGFDQAVVDALKASEGCSRIQVAIAPHAPYSCSMATLEHSVQLAKKYDLPFMSHMAETQSEMDIVREQYGITPVELYNKLGALSPRTIAAHCVYLSDNDIELLRKSGTAVAHNPQSNMKLASGVAPVAKMLESGVLTTIATDGACSNNDLDMWDELRTAALLQKSSCADPCVLPTYEVLKMATVYGAKAIGMEGKLGVVAQGALADLIVVDTHKPHMQPLHNVVSNLVYTMKSSDVQMVMVDGEMLVEDSVVKGVDLNDLFKRVNEAVEQITTSMAAR